MSLWMIWICVGAVMLLMEFAMPGVFICFFGIGALFTGVISFFFPGMSLIWQLMIFALCGTLCTFTGRKFFSGGVSSNKNNMDDDETIGCTATVSELITPDKNGKVEFRGSFWSAVSDQEISPGTQVVIVERKNLIFVVKRK